MLAMLNCRNPLFGGNSNPMGAVGSRDALSFEDGERDEVLSVPVSGGLMCDETCLQALGNNKSCHGVCPATEILGSQAQLPVLPATVAAAACHTPVSVTWEGGAHLLVLVQCEEVVKANVVPPVSALTAGLCVNSRYTYC